MIDQCYEPLAFILSQTFLSMTTIILHYHWRKRKLKRNCCRSIRRLHTLLRMVFKLIPLSIYSLALINVLGIVKKKQSLPVWIGHSLILHCQRFLERFCNWEVLYLAVGSWRGFYTWNSGVLYWQLNHSQMQILRFWKGHRFQAYNCSIDALKMCKCNRSVKNYGF